MPSLRASLGWLKVLLPNHRLLAAAGGKSKRRCEVAISRLRIQPVCAGGRQSHSLPILTGMVLVLAAISAASGAGASTQGPPVVMDPVTVRAAASKECHLSFRLKYIFWGTVDRAEFDRVDPASVVARSGIKPGDRIERIDGRPVRGMTVRDFIRSLSRANGAVRLLVDSGSEGGRRQVQVVFPPNYWTWNMDNPPKAGPTGTPRATSP